MTILTFLKIFNIICFFYYGSSCLFSKKMQTEFTRYGLSSFRPLTGFLQIAGSLSMGLGFFFAPFTTVASAGLMVLMLLGVGVRIKIRDRWFMVLPAFFFMILNLLILLISLQIIADFQLVF